MIKSGSMHHFNNKMKIITLFTMLVLSLRIGAAEVYLLEARPIKMAADTISVELPEDVEIVPVTLYRSTAYVGSWRVTSDQLSNVLVQAKGSKTAPPFLGKGAWYAVTTDTVKGTYALFIHDDQKLCQLCNAAKVTDSLFVRSSIAETFHMSAELKGVLSVVNEFHRNKRDKP